MREHVGTGEDEKNSIKCYQNTGTCSNAHVFVQGPIALGKTGTTGQEVPGPLQLVLKAEGLDYVINAWDHTDSRVTHP